VKFLIALLIAVPVFADDDPIGRYLYPPELIMSPDDPNALADALEMLASDRAKTKQIGKAARDLSVSKYTWRRAVTDTFAEIEKLQRRTSGVKAAL